MSIFLYVVLLIRRPATFSFSRDIFWLGLFILAVLASLIHSPNLAASIKGLRKLSLYLPLFLAIPSCVTTQHRLRTFLYFLIASAALVSLNGFYQAATGADWFSGRTLMPYPHLGIKRMTSSFHQAGALGIYLGSVAPLSMALFLDARRAAGKWIWGCATLLMLGGLAWTFAPGSILGVFSAITVLALIKKKWWIVLLALAVMAAGFLVLPESLTSWPHGSFFSSFVGRAQMWKTALKIFWAHPFLGGSWHSFPHNYQAFCLPGQPHCGGGAPYAHNQYIQILAELGIAGFLAFCGFIFILLKRGWECLKIKGRAGFLPVALAGLLASMAAYLSHGFLESSIYTSQGALLFWMLAGLLKATVALRPRPKLSI